MTRGGGERVAECLAALLPSADLFALVADADAVPTSLRPRGCRTSFLQRIPGAVHHHRHMLPLYPEAARSIDLRGYDLIVSSDAGPIKAVRTRPDAVHLCYCHSPMRYLYDGYESYRAQMPAWMRLLFSATAARVRRADQAAAKRVTQFIANSNYVADRIARAYGRDSTVVHPPIDLQRYARVSSPGSHYLCAGRLVPYKRTELMVQACTRMNRALRVVGTGPDLPRLRARAGPLTKFLGELPTEQLWQQYSECRALLFAADEDFGMVPLEAQSCGRPVIAYGHGGSLETVRGLTDAPTDGAAEGPTAATGLFFAQQTVEALCDAILRFEANESRFTAAAAQANAARFATPVFLSRMHEVICQAAPFAREYMATPEAALAVLNGSRLSANDDTEVAR